MNDRQTELKLQALLDGELSATERESVQSLMDRDAEAKALYVELQTVKSLIAGKAPEMKVAETREFYWSGILRRIEQEERANQPARSDVPSHAWWLKLFIPAAAVAILTLTLTVGLHPPGSGRGGFPALAGNHQIETPLEDTPSFTFRSEPEAMTVVWVDSGPN
jgi:anti-sigma factor RsiW